MTPGEIKALLTRADIALVEIEKTTANQIRDHQVTALRRALDDLQSRLGNLVDAGVEFLSSVWTAMEEAAKEFWEWLNG
jgi:hypothetical protein